MRLSRRSVLAGAGALAATGLPPVLGGCGGDGNGRAVHFTYMGDAYSQEGWNHRFERFQAEHPAVSLITKNVPSHNWADFFNRVTTQLAGGQPLDVLDIATEGQRLFASKGLLEPLDHFLRRDRAFSKELHADLHPALEKWTDKYASPDGRTYYLSAGGNPVCMWYNADLLRKAGLEDPGPDWTWDDFYRICVQVKRRTGAYGYAAVASQFDGILPWLLTNGVSTLDESWTRPTVTDPHAIEAAAFNRRLVQEKLSPEPGGTFDAFTAAAQGRLAMFGGGRWPIVTIRNLKAVEKFRIIPWPRKRRPGSPLGFDGYPIMKESQHKGDSWELLKFIVSKPSMRAFAAAGGTNVPARRSVATSPAFLDNSPKGTEYLFAAFDYAVPVPSPERGTAVQRDVEDAWQQILVGNLSPGEGMRMLQDNLEASLATTGEGS